MPESGPRSGNRCADSSQTTGSLTPSLSPFQIGRVYGRLQRWTCSWRWHQDVYDQVIDDPALYRHTPDDQERALQKKAVWPPGGFATGMKRCEHCGLWMPPQAIGSDGQCLDCFYGALPAALHCFLPSAITADTPIPDRDLPAHLASSPHTIRRKRIRRTLQTNTGRRVRVRCPKRRLEVEADQILGSEFVLQEELLDDGQVLSALLPMPDPSPGVPGNASAAA